MKVGSDMVNTGRDKLGATKVRFIITLILLVAVSMIGCQRPEITSPPPPTIPPNAKLVCLFFDDGFKNQYDVALPILQKYDFKASFAIITGYIGVKSSDPIYTCMTAKEIKKLASYGMDIACHTKTHPHLTDNLTDEQLREEIIDSKIYLEQKGFEVSTLVYPFYAWDDRVIEYVKEAGYICARSGWAKEEAYDLTTADPKARYHVPSWQITSQNLEQFKHYLAQASRYSVVCLIYHFISDTSPEETSTPVANFRAQMAYLKEAGFTVVLLPDLFR